MSDDETPVTKPAGRPSAFSGHPWWWWATAAVCALGILGSIILLNF